MSPLRIIFHTTYRWHGKELRTQHQGVNVGTWVLRTNKLCCVFCFTSSKSAWLAQMRQAQCACGKAAVANTLRMILLFSRPEIDSKSRTIDIKPQNFVPCEWGGAINLLLALQTPCLLNVCSGCHLSTLHVAWEIKIWCLCIFFLMFSKGCVHNCLCIWPPPEISSDPTRKQDNG